MKKNAQKKGQIHGRRLNVAAFKSKKKKYIEKL